eukprot:Colp12_sorted_trinity150504_noHs@32859
MAEENKLTSTDPDFLRTLYQKDFPCHPIPKTASCKPMNGRNTELPPFEGQSTSKSHYLPWDARPASSKKPRLTAVGSGAPFEGVTTQRLDFTAKSVRVPAPLRPPYNHPQYGPFDGTSTMRDHFRLHGSISRPQLAKPIHQSAASTQPFNSKTAYQLDYAAKPLPPKAVVNVPRPNIVNRPEMHLSTTYNRTYTPKPVRLCPALKVDETFKERGCVRVL